jgi:hypothetical protein
LPCTATRKEACIWNMILRRKRAAR